MSKKQKRIQYLGLFLDDSNIAKIDNHFGQSDYSSRFIHHLTVKFNPSLEETARFSLMMGDWFEIEILGWAWDHRAQVAVVRKEINALYKNIEYPHITLYTNGCPPKVSNEILANFMNSNFKYHPLKVRGRLGAMFNWSKEPSYN